MTKKEYAEALRSFEWREKREVILKRDSYTCTKCGCKEDLQVHHTYYLPGKMPWEVPNSCLVTLCRTCHKKEHKGKKISDFVKHEHKSKGKKKKLSKRKRKDRLFKFSDADYELQKKYDALKESGKIVESSYKQLSHPKDKKKRRNNKP